ncbi:hypothetical protein H257_10939 [Aphanomyces astaci]|uniref:Uncharacterized protein n=1 Tax=Aphanomyces astaci TaxID=112090 RepID=W4G5Y5_APHAT|nr:hypothetical protein H257_10939 [Aphanomyces astaci]ETV74348.1 hypothetical protein H257_10939 [Aphanomyces astaci]|eukprot:XP_009836006.1 hypothetical protein H257_10939 [Aphanomyces astaci]
MARKWTSDCEAERVLRQLFEDGTVSSGSSPGFVRALALDIFNQFSDAVFNIHLRLTKIKSKFTSELENTATKAKTYAKIQAFAFAMQNHRQNQQTSPMSTQLVDLPLPVIPHSFEFNVGVDTIDEDVIIVEFMVQGNSSSHGNFSLQK